MTAKLLDLAEGREAPESWWDEHDPELLFHCPKFSEVLAKVLAPSDEVQPAATEKQIAGRESVLAAQV